MSYTPANRRPGDQRFTKTEIQRLIKCAKREGLQNYRIDVHRDGITLIVDNTKTANDDTMTEVELKELI